MSKTTDYTKKFPDRLAYAMARAEITQEELAKKSGTSQTGVSYYLKGERFPRIKTFYRIADALKVNPMWLMGLDSVENAEDILALYAKLDTQDRYKVVGYIYALLDGAKYNHRMPL